MNKPAFLASLVDNADADSDRLQHLRNKVIEAKQLELEIDDLNNKLSELKHKLQEIHFKVLPDLFDEIGVDKIGVPASGNLPAFEAKCQPYYNANISANWDPERRSEAFAYLTEVGAGDLIKTSVALDFARDEREKAVELADKLKEQGLRPNVKEAVHSQTLTAWLREQVEVNNSLPNLEKIGGQVGRIVKLKDK